MSNLPQETINRIEAEAKKAATILEWGEYDAGPINSAMMQQVSRVDPIQKEFYVKGAIKWAGKAHPAIDALSKISNHSSECGCVPCVGQCRTSEALQMEIDGLKEIAFIALAKYKEVSNG